MVSSVMWRARRPDSRAGLEQLRGGARAGDATASFVHVPERRLFVSDAIMRPAKKNFPPRGIVQEGQLRDGIRSGIAIPHAAASLLMSCRTRIMRNLHQARVYP